MKRFNIRVYGIWINDRQQILVSDERIGDFKFTKFPGGGSNSVKASKIAW